MNNIKNPIKRNKRVYLLTIDKFANLYIPIDRGHIVDVFKYERDLVRRIDERRQILFSRTWFRVWIGARIFLSCRKFINFVSWSGFRSILTDI